MTDKKTKKPEISKDKGNMSTDTAKKIDAIMVKEEEILSIAVAKSLSEINKKFTSQKSRDYEAAKAALETFRRKKQQQENSEEARFTAPEAVEYLNSEGYKIKESKLYAEKAIIGFTTINNVITFAKKNLDFYAKKQLAPLTGNDSNMADRKMAAEANIAEQKFKDMEFEAKIKQGMYILRSDVEQMLAARAAFLKDNLGQGFIHARASKIIEIIQGNTERIPELIDFWLKQIEEVFDYYSKPMRFEVPIALIESEEEIDAIN